MGRTGTLMESDEAEKPPARIPPEGRADHAASTAVVRTRLRDSTNPRHNDDLSRNRAVGFRARIPRGAESARTVHGDRIPAAARGADAAGAVELNSQHGGSEATLFVAGRQSFVIL